jgi:predicted GIY-YIG superfamily endonuclease
LLKRDILILLSRYMSMPKNKLNNDNPSPGQPIKTPIKPSIKNRREGTEPLPIKNRREGTEPLKEPPDWQFYIIYHTGCGATYAGVSPDPVRRLRMHNGEICGGAKYTTSKGPGWVHVCLVSGFPTKQNSMQFEWAIKHVPPRNVGGLESRLRKLGILFRKEQWTSKSPLAESVPLEIEWRGVALGTLTPPCGVGMGFGVGGAGIDADTTNFKVFGVERSVVGALPEYVREIVIK